MPYLTKSNKEEFDSNIDSICRLLLSKDATNRAGIINYIITCLAFRTTPKRYWALALTVGTILCAILEFYRRWVAPYEDKKIKENGDVYPKEDV